MKKFGIAALCTAVIAASVAFVMPAGDILEIGAAAPNADTKMKDVSGEMMSLNDVKKANGLLVVFSCNSCPFVVGGPGYGDGWEGRYNELHDFAARAQVGMVLVNSNEGKRDGADSFEKMKSHAADQKYKANYVVDENSALADAFGARTTPHVFLFDGDMKLLYKGAIDDNNKSYADVKENWLKEALGRVAGGTQDQIDPNSTRQMGCSIKRVKK